MVWYDFAWSVPSPATVIANGGTGVLQYSSRDASKDITARTRDMWLAAGLDIGIVFEDRTGNPWGGAAQGTADGLLHRSKMDALACPQWMSAMFAIDQATPESDWPVLDAYTDAFIAQQGGRPLGVYTTTQYLQHLVDTGRLQATQWFAGATSWSHGIISDQAHLIQRVGSPISGTDLNDVQRHPFGSWLAPMDGVNMDLTPQNLNDIAATVWNYPMSDTQTNPNQGGPAFAYMVDGRWAVNSILQGMASTWDCIQVALDDPNVEVRGAIAINAGRGYHWVSPQEWGDLQGLGNVTKIRVINYAQWLATVAQAPQSTDPTLIASTSAALTAITEVLSILQGNTPADPGDADLHAKLAAQLRDSSEKLSTAAAAFADVVTASVGVDNSVADSLTPTA